MAEIRGRTAEDRYHFLLSYVNTDYIASKNDLILVTGSNGFIGSKVVEILLEYGFANLRCFVRPSSQLDRLEKVLGRFDAGGNVELVTGDLLSREDCRKAAAGVSIIYHLAAGMEKSFAGAFMNSALATRNLMDAFLECGQAQALCECQFLCGLFEFRFETRRSA